MLANQSLVGLQVNTSKRISTVQIELLCTVVEMLLNNARIKI